MSCGLAVGLGALGLSGEKPERKDRVRQRGRGWEEPAFTRQGWLCVPARVRIAGSFLEWLSRRKLMCTGQGMFTISFDLARQILSPFLDGETEVQSKRLGPVPCKF